LNRRTFVARTLAGGAGLAVPLRSFGQNKAIEPGLSKLTSGKGLTVFNRSVSPLTDGTRQGIRLDEAPGEGLAYLEGIEFANGRIEVDIKGKDVVEQSLLGVAFHGIDGTTSDAVYFRPFNFRAEDPVRRGHAVQYISSPDYKWRRLRTDQPGKFENSVHPVPDPNGWFRARIVVASPRVTVFVGDGKVPSLEVSKLNDRRKGLAGLWVDNFGGDFANLRIVPA
jgi:hypothetical protein